MGYVSWTPDKIRGVVDAFEQCGRNKTETARVTGLSPKQVRHALGKAAEQGLDPHIQGAVPYGHVITGTSTLIKDGEGTVQWIKTKSTAEQQSPEDVALIIKEALSEITPRERIDPPNVNRSNLLAFFPLTDWHIGLLAWAGETGEDWDLNIAYAKIMGTMERVVASMPNADQALVLGLGDLMHADNSLNRTLRSGNPLDVDSRYSKCLHKAAQMVIETIEMVALKFPSVQVELLPGNHDEHSTAALKLGVKYYFRNSDHINVRPGADYHYATLFGKTLIAGTHGDGVKLANMGAWMANSYSEMWGKSDHRYGFSGHIHHKSTPKTGDQSFGACIESLNAPVASDSFHHQHGYNSPKLIPAMLFDKDQGRVHSQTVPVL